MAASTKELQKLEFVDPVFHDGVNATTRFGAKWLERGIVPGDRVTIHQSGCESLGEAVIVGVLYMPFRLIPTEVFALESHPKVQTADAVADVLKSIYDDFDRDSPCTVILFCSPDALDTPAPPKPKGEAKGDGKAKGKGGGKGKGKEETPPTETKPEGDKPEGAESKEADTKSADSSADADKSAEGGGEKPQG